MPKPAVDILLTFPPRMLSPAEQTLVQEWLELANDVPLAYVSQRRSDDPTFFGRVVIATGSDREAKPHHPCACRIGAVAGHLNGSTPKRPAVQHAA